MSKRILSMVLIAMLSLSLVACGDSGSNVTSTDGATNTTAAHQSADSSELTVESLKSAPATEESAFTYEVIDGQMTITDYTGSDEIVVIPDTIEGQSVVSIGDSAFANNDKVRGVRIPDSVADIERNAFCNCYGLEVFVSGNGLKTIGEYAFSYCESLKNIELNVGLETLELSCFTSTDELKEIYIPSTVTTIVYPFNELETQVTIVSESGSVAEAYALEMDISFSEK